MDVSSELSHKLGLSFSAQIPLPGTSSERAGLSRRFLETLVSGDNSGIPGSRSLETWIRGFVARVRDHSESS